MDILTKTYIDFKRNIVGFDKNAKTFVELYRWAKQNGLVWSDICDCDDKIIISFSINYNGVVFIIECDFTENRVGETLIVASYVAGKPEIENEGDTTFIHHFVDEVDWWHDLGIAHALNNHSKCFENCSGITKLIYIPCDEVGNETDDKNADYICYDSDHDKIGYVFVLDETK